MAEATEVAGSPYGLTERELEVLELVVAGHSNREIGAALFISPKTASVHVSNILAKLDVDGRVEAATMALRLGIVGSGLDRRSALARLIRADRWRPRRDVG